ncbi:PDZ and LIM domain protein Zasp [Ptiloglossa arizonensis]|uniref:PDZ and LIM domain protein Zasp n=1 Tax=Ptiloglossa arizonensis TaxID=3350558 RepID=UPI003F9FB9D6
MAQLISVKLSRFDGSPWGFRLQGGKDFGTPLVVQKVNSGSPAEAAGLKAGDAVIRVNNTDMYNLRHKDAQDVIVRAGNNFELTVQRGGGTWKPHVTPLNSTLPSPSPTASIGNIAPVTKTSLAAKKQDGSHIGSGHNFSPKPFLNGTSDGSIKSIVNKQYNSPVGIYSEETIAETLSAQAEVLAGGVLGVNFKKNEKNYNAENSEVFKMVQEADKEPKTPEPVPSRTEFYSSVSHAVGGRATSPRSPTPLFHALHGVGPAFNSNECSSKRLLQRQESSSPSRGQSSVVCSNCDRAIVGVFVRIKEKNLHVECFKCSTCGTSLKNVGYYNINNKLYCDIHAKLVARQNAPAGLVPVTVPPGGKAPASTISAALANAPLSPPLSNHASSPLPFSACNRTSPDYGSPNLQLSTLNRNGCITNGECHWESKTFTSSITIQTGCTEPNRLGTSPVDPPSFRSVQAPASNNLIGPKPFGGSSNLSSSLSSPPLVNSGSSTLPRPQSQTVTENSTETHKKCYYYELIEETKTEPRASSVKAKSLNWPPQKPIEDITYPTASPLYIDPNPALDRSCKQAVKEKKACIEACERALTRKRCESTDLEVERVTRQCYRYGEDPMDRVSCPGPVYRKVELVEATERQSKGEITSRPSSTDSVRRSLTPTRIVQPIPKPWTATVTTGGSLYEQTYGGTEPPKVCKKFHQKEICQRERICERNQPFREEHRTYQSTVCRREQTICEKPPLPIQHTIKQEEAKEEVTEIDKEVTDLRPADEIEDDDDGVKVAGEHDFITETTEEDVDGMHVKKKTTFEKTIEKIPSPARPSTPMVEQAEECYTRKTATHIDREVKETAEEKTVVESAEVVTSAVDVQQMLEKAKQDEEERKREEEEEERRKQEEEERKRREEEEQRRRREEERRRQQEEEERSSKHVSFEEEVVEEVREQPLGRTVVREEKVTEAEGATPGSKKLIKETYEEITEEVLVQERVRKLGIEDERRKSLREQVEVHQSLRDQQAPKERRVCSKYPPAQEIMETNKKHVQFMKQTESGPKPIPHSALQNSTPKEWKSEMVNALTTAPDRPFTPVGTSNTTTNTSISKTVDPVTNMATTTSTSVKEVYTEETIYLDHRCRPKPPPEDIRPISPFQQALMIAPERPYTPLAREIGPEDQQIVNRSQTPVIQGERICPPADILFGEPRPKPAPSPKCTPRPLPTPPPDYRLRDASASPSRSRPQTPSSKCITANLKKPDTIPSYQKNLIAMRRGAVESHTYQPTSRTPTPTPCRSKSPAQGPPEPPACYVKAHAPRIREDPPPAPTCRTSAHFPTKKSVSYKVDEDTDEGHLHAEYAATKTVDFDEKQTDDPGQGPTDAVHAQYQEKRYMTSEETNQGKQSVVKKSLEVVEDFERCEKRTPTRPLPEPREKPVQKSVCAIGKTSPSRPTLPCPLGEMPSPQPVYSSSTEVRHVSYGTPPASKQCPDTGVTVLPCKAVSDKGTKAGVVVVPCEGPNVCCQQSGICVMPTPDRSGVCVSPCFGAKTGTCGQPSGRCGRESACDIELPNCPESGVCVSPCGDGSVCVAPCNKSGGICPKTKKLPFPQIPFPFEDPAPPTPAPAQNRSSFEPIHKPRTNLSGQLARLTAKTGHNTPTVQLYKPQAQCQTQSCCESSSSYCCKTQSFCSTQTRCQSGGQCSNNTRCQSGSRCETQNNCQDGIHCTPSSNTQSLVDPPNLSSHPDLGTGVGGLGGAGSKSGTFAGSSAPKRGRGVLNQATGPGSRLPLCAHCNSYVRGPFITALGQIWCPDHFVCVNTQCRRPLQDIGFVEEKGQLYCEYCFERFIAPCCSKCNNKIKGDCLNAIGKHFHPECFKCSYCGKLFGNSPFFLEEGLPYCEADWNELFTTKCFACGFPVEAGDRWVEALNNNYHSQCFNCTMCKKNLEGQSFYAKGGRPFCKNHAR